MSEKKDAKAEKTDNKESGLKSLLGNSFIGKSGSLTFDALKDVELCGIYFSAHWCGPCRNFTPKLIQAFNELVKNGKKVQIIFGSSDRDETSFKDYYKDMPWMSFVFGDKKISELKSKYGVSGIPWLVILDSNGNLIKNEADEQVGATGAKAFDAWFPKS